ncbi:PAS domain-containing protein [Pedobacter sp. MC2016-14]|uniref:ATP-binding protein n=1 Tax=Pedobacter sp. MC2016-14 TaxID=2897327 RepID=UPI001E639C6E|nr:ATP-binding protein [Pedobacter sp. MC2016-14]MCD0488973.1 PAS domain-containing protein [Pedobacter sp. MC2016-14]
MNTMPQSLPNEELLEILTHTQTATAVHIGEEATIRFANQAMIDIWGKDRSVIGKTLEEALPELKGQPFIGMFARVWREGLTIKGTDTPANLTIEGKLITIYFDFEYRAILDKKGKTICILHTAVDVTERFKKQNAEQQTALVQEFLAREQRLNEQLANSNEELAATNEELSAALEELRVSNEQLMQTKAGLRLLNEQLEQRVEERLKIIAELNTRLEVSAEELNKSNQELAAANEELTATVEELASSNHELHATYDQLKISQDETELAINAASLGTFDLDPRTGKFAGNQQLRDWFGLEPSDQIELHIATQVIAPEDRDKVTEAINMALDPKSGGHYSTYYTIINPIDPRPRIVQAKGKALFDDKGKATRLSGVLQDVTQQVQSAQEISEANTRMNIAIEAGSLGSTEVDLATGQMQCNEQFKKFFGRTKDQPFTYPDLFAAILPEYRERVRELVTIAKENRSVYQAQYQVCWPDGSIHWISAHGRARYDQHGKAIKMVGLISDITEAKADEQRKNDFIGMVSHELKTPLTSLNGYVQLLQRKAQSQGDNFSIQALEKANNQLKKMTGMINSFLNVSRLESGKINIEKKEFDLTLLIAELESEFNYTDHNHQLIYLPCGEILVSADRDKIGHVVSNLISNAVKYSPGGTNITITCSSNERNILVSVADQGNGISKNDQPHLFERYYRVSDQPSSISGFGIGLYLCAEIIERHNGKIWVESEPGAGSTFYFSLPIS